MMKVRYEEITVELSKRGTDGLIAYMAAVCEAMRNADTANASCWTRCICVIGDLVEQPTFTFGGDNDLQGPTPERPFIVRDSD